jgi:cell pole-organizing protein PopZ
MTDPAPQAATGAEEPSIEEILASIRKIISDEPGEEPAEPNGTASDAAFPDMPPPPTAADTAASEPTKTALAVPNTGIETADEGEDILDLSAFAEDNSPMTDPTETPAADAAADFDLGLEDNEVSVSAADIDMDAMMAASSFTAASTTPADGSLNDMGAGLVSDTSASVATAAMAKLAQAADPVPSETQLWVGARTIEQVVEDLMRPMLKTWLDKNLPTLVERLVEKELARMARRATE